MKRILYIGNKLSKHGLSPTSADILPDYLSQEGYKVMTASSLKNKALRLFHMIWMVLFRARTVDVVVIDTYSTSNFWYAVTCGMLCRILGVHYIFILHGGNLDQRFSQVSEWILDVFKTAFANVVPSKYLLEKLNTFNFNNIHLIPNWIDLKIYPFKARSHLDPKILWVRAFDEVYNPEMALEVIEELQKNHPLVKLCMVGPEKDGSLEKSRAMAKKKNLSVEFKGKLSKKEWIHLSNDFDVFINTTSVDNTPISLLESMALGLPVVSTNVGGIPYMIDDKKNGILVEPENPKEMAIAISDLIQDPQLAETLSCNARREVEEYDWSNVKPLWLELLS
ncbi:glycosyltransferase family 4 protein [Gramella jeungdoensis]|uniref:Glycosyltransferase family 4 protein n=1 Tax=Gramella jeungdoensis TaxID=708091 RepID=A0ABT0Z1G2_9FLAO|nr:glycosyltransferase family 4 protein [Gramella jeungdoensis]MCM8569230.1 glycosyltransferase family 4 protein [Gramella jeungdoensis]